MEARVVPGPPFTVRAEDFHPRPFFRNRHVQTIAGNLLPRPRHLPHPESVFVEVAPVSDVAALPLASLQPQPDPYPINAPPIPRISSRVLCHCHWQPAPLRSSALTVILVHGLEGSSSSQYICGNADKLWYSGCNVIRMNMRNCGGTDALSPTLYHSGLSGDVLAVLRFFLHRDHLSSLALVGYSMGGNLVLKLAGELGTDAPPELRSIACVSPVVDLAESADALHSRANRIYEQRFLKPLLLRFRRKAAIFPALFDPQRVADIHSIRDFDERITSPYSGFLNADDYYHRAASARVLDRIALPTLILHALDDPFIRLTPASRKLLTSNPHITLLEPLHGGHCAFLDTPDPRCGYDGYWAEHTVLRFLFAHFDPAAS